MTFPLTRPSATLSPQAGRGPSRSRVLRAGGRHGCESTVRRQDVASEMRPGEMRPGEMRRARCSEELSRTFLCPPVCLLITMAEKQIARAFARVSTGEKVAEGRMRGLQLPPRLKKERASPTPRASSQEHLSARSSSRRHAPVAPEPRARRHGVTDRTGNRSPASGSLR